MKCTKCGGDIHCTGWGGAPLPTLCDKCTYGDTNSADFRAFRRQVLLAIVGGYGPGVELNNAVNWWATADRIARAEPKE